MKKLLLITCLAASCFFTAAKTDILVSPDGMKRIEVSHGDRSVKYAVFHGDVLLVQGGPLEFKAGEAVWGREKRPGRVFRAKKDVEFNYVVPRKSRTGRDSYNAMTLRWSDHDIEFRAYDEGIAWRFAGRKRDVKEIGPEKSTFVFDPECKSYTLPVKGMQNWFEENYTIAPVGEVPDGTLTLIPMLVKAGGVNVIIGEADVFHYSASFLRKDGDSFELVSAEWPVREEIRENGNKRYVVERARYVVEDNTARTFPWRVIGIYADDASLFAGDLPFLLSRRSGEDWSWIRPGKVLWDWWNHRNLTGVPFEAGINTDTYLYLVDYAARHNFEYVLIDEGWSDRDDLLSLNPEVDIPHICREAEKKGVGICLWAKWLNVEKQMTEALDTFALWGVKGLKIDFMDRNDAFMVDFYERVAAECARRHMLVDFHGSYPNEGMRAAYPNLMTREGVLGLEYNKWSSRCTPGHQLLIPFIRQWAGPMDFTPGAMLNAQPKWFRSVDAEPMSQGTRCHQMAMYVVYESPLQMVSDSPSHYDANPEWFPWLENVPSVWDETRVLAAEAGSYVVVARRSGVDWYLAAMNAGSGRDLGIPLDFLSGEHYEGTFYSDGPNAALNAKDFTVKHEKLDRGDEIEIRLADNGGFAALLSPVQKLHND